MKHDGEKQEVTVTIHTTGLLGAERQGDHKLLQLQTVLAIRTNNTTDSSGPRNCLYYKQFWA